MTAMVVKDFSLYDSKECFVDLSNGIIHTIPGDGGCVIRTSTSTSTLVKNCNLVL